MINMTRLTVVLLLVTVNIAYNAVDRWSNQTVVWTKFHLIPKPVLSNFTKSFHSAYKNSMTTKAPKPSAISVKLNQTKDTTALVKGLLNVTTNERKVPVDSITLSSKVVGFPEDRTVPTRKPLATSTPAVVPRRRRRPVIRYEEESEEDDEEDDDEEDITDEFDVEDDDDEEEEEEEVEVVEEVPETDNKQDYEG